MVAIGRVPGFAACLALLVVTVSSWISGIATAESKFTQEAGLYRPVEGAPARVDVGSVGFDVDCLVNLPYEYPELFAFTDDEIGAARKKFPRYDRAGRSMFLQAKDDQGLTWIDPFTAPDGKVGLLAFRIVIQNRGTTPFDLSTVHVGITTPEGKILAATKGTNRHSYWLSQQEERFQKERGMNLAQQAGNPTGFVGALFYGYRFDNWAEHDGTALIVEPGKTRWGLLLFEQETKVDTVSVVLEGIGLSSDGSSSGLVSFPFRRQWKTIALDTKTKRWKIEGAAISSVARTEPPKARTLLFVGQWTAQGKEDYGDLRRLLEKLKERLDAVPRLDVKWQGQTVDAVPAATPSGPGHQYQCTGTLVTRSEKRMTEDGKNAIHYEMDASTTVTDPETGVAILSKTSRCIEDDLPTDDNGQYLAEGKFTDRNIVLWNCAEQIAKDFGREIANAFPLRGTVIPSDDGAEMRIDLGTQDGVERGMKFKVLRAEGAVGDVEKPAVEVGEIEVVTTGHNASGFKIKRVAKSQEVRYGDVVELKPREKSFLQKATEAMNKTTETIK